MSRIFNCSMLIFKHSRLRHRMIEEKHRGHEAMHAEMVLILFVATLLAQVVLVMWRLRHKKSYHVSITLYVTVYKFVIFIDNNFIWYVGDPPIYFSEGRILEDGQCVDVVLYCHIVCHI